MSHFEKQFKRYLTRIEMIPGITPVFYFAKKYLLLIIAQLLILYVSFVNIFPKGYILSGGDVYQFVELKRIWPQISMTWANYQPAEGIGWQFYGFGTYIRLLEFISDIIRLNTSHQAFLGYAIFLFGAFWSFYYSLSFYPGKLTDSKWKTIFSLVYTFNIFTLHNFIDNWIFTPFLILYVLLPAIFGLTYKFFNNKGLGLKEIALLGLFFSLTNISNSNLAFFISLHLTLLVFIFLIAVLYISPKILFLKKMIIYYLVSFSAVAFTVIPQVSEMIRQVDSFQANSSVFDLGSWILWQAPKFPIPFFMFPTDNLAAYLDKFSPLLLLSILMFMILFIFFILSKKIKKIAVIYIILAFITLILVNKLNGILSDPLVLSIFSNPLFGSLRSWDKTLIYLPLFTLTTIFLLVCDNLHRFHYRFLILLLFLGSLFSVYPFFKGGIVSKISTNMAQGEDYRTAKYSSIVKIPQDYLEVASKLNYLKFDQRLIRMPYNVINSFGWVNFPKWKQVGVDPTLQFFDMQNVQMNAYGAFGKWAYGERWNREDPERSRWLLSFSGFLNARYIIYHKDVDDKFIEQTLEKIKYYQDNGLISLVSGNEYFDLYKIKDNYYLPRIYSADQFYQSDKSVEALPEVLKDVDWVKRPVVLLNPQNKNKESLATQLNQTKGTAAPTIEYKKVNPTKYRVVIHSSSSPFPLVFSESFHSEWRIFPGKLQGESLESMKQKLSDYKILEGNEDDQASIDELDELLNKGSVSSLGNNKNKEVGHYKYGQDYKSILDHNEKYKIDFISKGHQGTIQNNNLSDGKFFETWFKKPLESENHFTANGYANGWLINPDEVCKSNLNCKKNADGSYDFEILIEYWPQRLFYMGSLISGLAVSLALGYLIYSTRRRNV